jgi:hypothetical protein
MSWHDLIFSNQSKQRVRRHLASCFLWWAFIILSVFFTPTPEVPKGTSFPGLPRFSQHQPGLEELGLFSYCLLVLVKSFLLVLIHLFFCYAVIYILLPAFQLKKNYWLLVSGIVLASILVLPMGYFLYTEFIRPLTNYPAFIYLDQIDLLYLEV